MIIFAATILPLNIFQSELPYSYPFRNASLPTEGPILQILPKMVTMATSLEELEKEVKIDHLRTNTYYLVQNTQKLVQWILR